MSAEPVRVTIRMSDGKAVVIDGFDIEVLGIILTQQPDSELWSVTHFKTGRYIAYGFESMAEAHYAVRYAEEEVDADWMLDILWEADTPEWVERWRQAAYESRSEVGRRKRIRREDTGK